MRRRRPVLDVGLSTNFADSNSASFVAPVFHSSNFPKENDVSINAVASISDLQGVPYQHVAEFDPSQTVCASKPYTPWQVCADENTGYTYYWNVETNQVTWEIPADYLAYEAALQQYQLVQAVPSSNEIHPLIKHKIARTTQEVVANRNATSKKLIHEGKSISIDNDQAVLTPYGPNFEDDFEDAEARKIASARKRLLSYKSDKLKQKVDESTFSESYTTTPPAPGVLPVSYPSKTEVGSCKIPFVPTPDEIKEHPIFSNFSSSHNLNDESADSMQVSKSLVTRHVDPAKPSLVAEQYCSDEESDDNEDEHTDDVIITRLRKKALMLQELGGDVPKEIISVLDDSKTAKDIIAEIEKEIPPDMNDNDSLMEMDLDTDEETENVESLNYSTQSKPMHPTSNLDKGTESKESRPHQRSQPMTRKTQMKNIQKIKLSARARELIKTSLLTAKARATNFVETDDGLKPAEEVLEQKKEIEKIKNAETSTSKTESIQDSIELPEERRKREEMKRSEPDVVPNVVPNFVNTKLAEFSPDTVAPTTNSVYCNFIPGGVEFDSKASNLSASLSTNGERLVSPVVGDNDYIKDSSKLSETDNKLVKPELLSEKSKEDLFGFQSSFVIPNAKRVKVIPEDTETKKVSLVSKCEEFLQSVKKNSDENETKKKISVKEEEKKNIPVDIDIDAVLNTNLEDDDKNVMDFSQLIMEKLKFLNDGKSSVTAVQVMAIQIETLIGAWQTKALTTKYLQDWLNVSSVHLKNIEEAAAPKGWQCEWDRNFAVKIIKKNLQEFYVTFIESRALLVGEADICRKLTRSYGRYYYRNMKTGTIQWDFPETENIPSVRKKHRSDAKSSRKRPRTPPPPTISDMIVPPPPPIISDIDTRNQKLVINRPTVLDQISITECQTDGPIPVVPPLPALPCAPSIPPPPPPSELPFAPPSPPVISETVIPSVKPVDEKLEPVVSSKKNISGLYDELNSFYSDIATLEATHSQNTDSSDGASIPMHSTVSELPHSETTVTASKFEEKGTKKKKKVKLDSTLSLKKKGLEGLVAKWQKVNADI